MFQPRSFGVRGGSLTTVDTDYRRTGTIFMFSRARHENERCCSKLVHKQLFWSKRVMKNYLMAHYFWIPSTTHYSFHLCVMLYKMTSPTLPPRKNTLQATGINKRGSEKKDWEFSEHMTHTEPITGVSCQTKVGKPFNFSFCCRKRS